MYKKGLSISIMLFSILSAVFSSSAINDTSNFNLIFEKIESAEIGFYADTNKSIELKEIDFKLAPDSPNTKIHTTDQFYIGWDISGPGSYTLTLYSSSDYDMELEEDTGKPLIIPKEGYSLMSLDGKNKMNLLLIDDSGNFKIGEAFNQPADWQQSISAAKRTYTMNIPESSNISSSNMQEVKLMVDAEEDYMEGPFKGYLFLILSNSN